MTVSEQVFDRALTLAGELEERRAKLLELLCGGAVSALSAQLREGLKPEDCLEDFTAAACLMALAGLMEAGEDASVERFTAGDVSVQREKNTGAAGCLRAQARGMMAPWLRDSVAFLGV